MTATTIDEIDARSTWQRQLDEETPADEFSEDEMNMIDVAAVHVYKKARAALPSDLVDFNSDGDPAGVIRSWAYQWAHENPDEIHSRTGGRIVKHVRRRLRQDLKRYLAHRLRTLPTGFDPETGKLGLEVIAEEKREKRRDIFTTTRPVKRPQPIKYRQDRSPFESTPMLTMLDLYGRFIPEDQRQFIIKGHREGKPVRESAEAMGKLHTRRPTRAEYWQGVLDGNSHRTARADLALDTELHANTIAAIVEDVAPAVSERFSTGPRPVDAEDVDRKRLALVSEEVQRVLLEKFDVLYED